MNWNVFWDVLKVLLIPLAIWYFERQIEVRDNKREREYTARKREQDAQQKKMTDMTFLMMERIDNLSEMTHLMAKKLHDAGIINGDLEDMDKKYKGLNDEYQKSLKSLALEVLNK